MKRKISIRIIAALLVSLLTFYGCTEKNAVVDNAIVIQDIEKASVNKDLINVGEDKESVVLTIDESLEILDFENEEIIEIIEEELHEKIIEEFDSEDYFVENVSVKYISQEYIDEIEFNSKSNVYFGYSPEELDELFQGTRYVFTLDDNGETKVTELEEYDDTYEKVVRNVAIGTGVILVCVVVSVATAGTTAPAVSVIFAAAAKAAIIEAVSDGIISAIIAGTITGVSHGSKEEILKAAALSGSEGFMWGSITGTITGGLTEGAGLYGATLNNGLTMNDAAIIQREAKLSKEFINKIGSMSKYEELKAIEKNGGMALKDLEKICKNSDASIDFLKTLKGISEYDDLVKLEKEGKITIQAVEKVCKEADISAEFAKELLLANKYDDFVKIARNGGLSLKQAETLYKKSGYSLDIIKLIKSEAEGAIYVDQAELTYEIIGNNVALVRKIDLYYESELAGEVVTNLERMEKGYAAIDPLTDLPYELHHIGQNVDSPLAILSKSEHMQGGNNAILHDASIANGEGVHALLSDAEWAAQRTDFWKNMYKFYKP